MHSNRARVIARGPAGLRFLLMLLIPAALLAGGGEATAQGAPKTKEERISYAIGVNIGTSLKSQGIPVKTDMLSKGLTDAFKGGKMQMTEAEVQKVLTDFRQEQQEKQMNTMKEQGEKNKKEGSAFLAANAKKPGIKVTQSGLQYKVMTEGTGKMPGPDNSVVAHYRGTLIDGQEFDSSHSRGQPAEFPVKGVIPGWTEVLQLMKTGAKYMVYIPSELAYGERGAPPRIGPHAALVFEIELLEVK
ncbi:MAG: FKBP-type peptidyl-prolyl cis-trans isomerase [Deltaproteobacteria bacterium]|nr:FKBP-type peptidyl-prolyl cis-trans isomerase [Deltaproteobacteria bacterium]